MIQHLQYMLSLRTSNLRINVGNNSCQRRLLPVIASKARERSTEPYHCALQPVCHLLVLHAKRPRLIAMSTIRSYEGSHFIAGNSQPSGPNRGIVIISPDIFFVGFEKEHSNGFPKVANHLEFTTVIPLTCFQYDMHGT